MMEDAEREERSRSEEKRKKRKERERSGDNIFYKRWITSSASSGWVCVLPTRSQYLLGF